MLRCHTQMFDEDSNQKESGGQKKPPTNGFAKIPTFTLLAWAGIIVALIALVMLQKHYQTPPIILSQAEFLEKFQSNQISKATINLGGQSSIRQSIGECCRQDLDVVRVVQPPQLRQ